ncbi:MAG: hypothetical protein K2N05_00150 [Muribaculaceae bacterium]|nr:hypothetical protein [Muribaculaceae bacterium]
MKKFVLFLSVFISFCTFGQTQDIKEISLLRAQADSLHSIGKSDSAIMIGEKAITLSKKINNKVQIMGTLAGQGVYLRSVGRIEDALKSYGAAMEIATSKEFRNKPSQEAIEEIASLYINMAVLDLDMQHKDEAATNAVKAGEWCEKSKDPEFKATVLGVVGSVLTGCGKLEEASKYQSLAYSNAKEAGDDEASFRAAAYAMLISDRSGDKSKTEEWRKICRNLLPEMESLMAKLVYYQAECSICLKNDDKKGSLEWFDKIINSEGIDNLPFVKFAYRLCRTWRL